MKRISNLSFAFRESAGAASRRWLGRIPLGAARRNDLG
jgi:hypothetical protein